MSYVRQKLEKTFGPTGTRNLINGLMVSALYFTATILIPFLTLTSIMALDIEGTEIEITESKYQKIIYWIIAIGSIITATAFCTHSAPPQSIRKGALSVVQVFLNCLYVWSYQISGALDLNIELVDFGIITLNLTQLIIVYLGVYLFTVLIKVINLVKFISKKDEIRFKRGK